MKIILFGTKQICEYVLPNKILGTFRFDEFDGEENKLINIEAQDGVWIIKSTLKTKIFNSKGILSNEQKLEKNTFYILERDNIRYLMYVEDVLDLSFVKYKYNNNMKFIIGNSESSDIYYDCNFIDGPLLSICFENGNLFLETKGKNDIYINKQKIKNESSKYSILYGDLIEAYGIRIMILNSMILINNPNNALFIKDLSVGLEKISLKDDQPLKKYDLKEMSLYNDNDYFSKAPRLRRVIQNKSFQIDNPPTLNEVSDSIPLLYKIGPMLSMGIYSVTNVINVFLRISSGETTMKKSWATLVTSFAMLCSTFLWPRLTENFTKKQRNKKNQLSKNKYREYLKNKEKELHDEAKLQKDILEENLLSNIDCYNIIINKEVGLWSRRVEHDDFLTVCIGLGEYPLDINISYPEEGFSVDENLLINEAQNVGKSFMKLNSVPISYSFFDRKITAVMGNEYKSRKFIENILIQLVTFHSYEDLKIIFITSEDKETNWEFIKYLPHCFDNERQLRFFATDLDDAKTISNYLEEIYNIRKNNLKEAEIKPYYIVITDNYQILQKTNMLKFITEIEDCGFRLLILENKLGNLPSKCNNFISLNNGESSIIEDAYENQKIINFVDQIVYHINMNDVARRLLNIPIRMEKRKSMLPDAITFLEMENVGQVEQLNIINRWKTSDSTLSLKTAIGVDENNDILYLDIHEKYHGPHGLIAGMTGSGKSELIITYVLSMAMNYSPHDVAFVLIDYKGGGLAGAFENKSIGYKLPHLAGTITNLDKAELDRTLVSIESELRRRQTIFNEVRDKLGESTIDIYKYQRYYKEKKVNVPIPHLIIICDEFAELKSQQPEFMDDLISTARIGRSLGVHLILATQKPSGVVNDQIWSNSKFRICLKVQEASDSNEMLKRPDAALLKQVGRFYLQVGYDELFTLGQSAWCGAKYYPSDTVYKHVDKSINYINNVGNVYKSAEEITEKKVVSNGEQISNILKHIIEAAKIENIFINRLWLDRIPEIIYVDNLIKKYDVKFYKFMIDAIIGEYDDPDNQRQDILKVNLNDDGNIIIIGSEGSDREMAVDSIIYSTITRHTSDEINYYIIDYGSESLSKFNNFPHVGDIVLNGENEKLFNLFNMIDNIMIERKKILSAYGGQYNSYIKQGGNLSQIGIIINNFDFFNENNPMEDTLIRIARDGKRYGIFLILSANSVGSIRMKLQQNFDTILALRLNDYNDYSTVVGRSKIIPMEVKGRGLLRRDNVYEFQTSSIYPEEQINNYFMELIKKMKELNYKNARKIPVLPDIVTLEYVNDDVYNLSNVPIGIYKDTLDIVKYNFTYNKINLIVSERQENTLLFSSGLIKQLSEVKNSQLLVIDINKELNNIKENIKNYFCDNPIDIISLLVAYVNKFKENIKNDSKGIIYFQNFSSFANNLDEMSLVKFFNDFKSVENINIVIVNDAKEFKSLSFLSYLRSMLNMSSGIWLGRGIENQTLFMLSNRLRELSDVKSNNFGFVIDNNFATLFKTIELEDGDKNGK